MEPPFGAAVDDLFATSYHAAPMFSPNPFEGIELGDLLPDADGNGIIQSSADTYPAEDDTGLFTADPMEIAHELQEVAPPAEVDVDPGHQGLHPAGDAAPVVDTGMGKTRGELEVNSLDDTNGTKACNQPEPCSGNTIPRTATDEEIIERLRAWAEHHKDDNKRYPSQWEVNEDLAKLEPWKVPAHKQVHCATKMWGSDDKTFEGGCWKETDFRRIRRYRLCSLVRWAGLITAGCYTEWLSWLSWLSLLDGLLETSEQNNFGVERTYMWLERTLVFHKKDGTKTDWRMSEILSLRASDGHLFLEAGDPVLRRVYQSPGGCLSHPYGVLHSPSRISGNTGEGEDAGLNRCGSISHSNCLHHHDNVQNNQAPSPSGKRLRTDDAPKKAKLNVWQHFTRIYIKVPKEAGSRNKKDGKKLIYAVCNYCDKVFNADTSKGTSHHDKHAKACMKKHSQSQPSSSHQRCSPDISGGCGDFIVSGSGTLYV